MHRFFLLSKNKKNKSHDCNNTGLNFIKLIKLLWKIRPNPIEDFYGHVIFPSISSLLQFRGIFSGIGTNYFQIIFILFSYYIQSLNF